MLLKMELFVQIVHCFDGRRVTTLQSGRLVSSSTSRRDRVRSRRQRCAEDTWRRQPGYLLTAIIATLLTVVEVSGQSGGTLSLFQLQVTSVQNKDSSTADGAPCRGTSPPECSTFARVCLTNFQNYEQVDESTPCQFAEKYTPILGESRASFNYSFMSLDDVIISNDSINVVNMSLSFRWQEKFTLIVELYNDETGLGPQSGSPRQLIQRDVISCAEGCVTSRNWTSRGPVVQSTHLLISFAYEYRIICPINYFGPRCAVYCIPRDDSNGHWTCDPKSGNRTCIDGWYGEHCMKATCKSGCVKDNALPCTAPNDCRCRLGWRGELCDRCVMAANCSSEHATCTVPGECNCQPGWSGDYCTVDLNYCLRNNPCKNGGTCVSKQNEYGFVCACPIGFTGTNCENGPPKCSSNSCLNGAQCNSTAGNCICASGFTGNRCESKLPTGCEVSGCWNGGKCRSESGTCSCLVGFTGSFCETTIDACQLLQPCFNGGLCHVTSNELGYRCVCSGLFRGSQCNQSVSSTPSPQNLRQLTGKTTHMDDVIVTGAPTHESTVNSSSPVFAGALPSRSTGNNDVTQLVLIVCLGVVLPVIVVIATATVWTVCRRRIRHQRRSSNKSQTPAMAASVSLPTAAAVLPETVDNQRNEVHNNSRTKTGYDCDSDVTVPVQCSASPVTLTIVNAVSSDVSKGSNSSTSMTSASYRRIRRDIDDGGFGDCSHKNLDDNVSVVASSRVTSCGDLDRSFKNARRAAANGSTDVTRIRVGCDIIASEVGSRCVSHDVNVLRCSDCGECRGRDDVTCLAARDDPPVEVERSASCSAVSRDTVMTSTNDVRKLGNIRQELRRREADQLEIFIEAEQRSNLRCYTSPLADESIARASPQSSYACNHGNEFPDAKCIGEDIRNHQDEQRTLF